MNNSADNITRRNFVAAASLAAAAVATVSTRAYAQEPAEIKAGTPDETSEADIVIVGAGCAGMMAAYEAGKAGVEKIIVVSNSQSALDTNGSMVSGTSAVETSYTKDAGETETIEQMFEQTICPAPSVPKLRKTGPQPAGRGLPGYKLDAAEQTSGTRYRTQGEGPLRCKSTP